MISSNLRTRPQDISREKEVQYKIINISLQEKGCAFLKRRMAMKLELTGKEKDTLIGVLKDYIPELRGEIASGVKHDLKVELKEEEAVLNEVLEKLKILQ